MKRINIKDFTPNNIESYTKPQQNYIIGLEDYVINLEDKLKAINDGWIKYDPKDKSTWPKENKNYDVWVTGLGVTCNDTWETPNFLYFNKVTHYRERPSKPLEI